MDIGEPQRIYVVEPVEDPFRRQVDVPAEPAPAETPEREPDKVPA